jgi:hypothetical protein
MSLPLQIDLRPSRFIPVALCLLAVLALTSLWLSAAPRWALLVVPAALALAWPRAAAGCRARLLLHPDGGATVFRDDGSESAVVIARLQWRGPLCVITITDAQQRQRHVLTPDVLSAATRRELTLWFDRHDPDTAPGGAVAHV